MSDQLVIDGSSGNSLGVPPRGLEITCEFVCFGIIDMTGWEGVDLVADGCQSFEFRGKENSTGGFGRAADIEGCDADGISGGDCSILFLVIENEGEHAIELFGSINIVFQIQWDDNFAIAVRLEVVGGLEMLPQDSVVVDLAVDGQSHGTLIVDQRLGTAVDADDTKSFVTEDGVVPRPVARPVGSAMPQTLDTLQGLGFEGGYRRMAARRALVSLMSFLTVPKKKDMLCMATGELNIPMAGEDTTHD